MLADKLSPIVGDDYARNTISRDDISPYELADLLVCNRTKGLGFHIFGKIIDSHDDELSLSLGWWEGAKEIYTHLSKGRTA